MKAIENQFHHHYSPRKPNKQKQGAKHLKYCTSTSTSIISFIIGFVTLPL